MKTIILDSFAYAEFSTGGFLSAVSVIVTTDNCQDMLRLCFLEEGEKFELAEKLEDAMMAFAKINPYAPELFVMDNSISQMLSSFMQGRHSLECVDENIWRFIY